MCFLFQLLLFCGSRSQVRLLTGVGRYDEMTYIFDLLHQSHSFEALLRKKLDTGRGQVSTMSVLKDLVRRLLVWHRYVLPSVATGGTAELSYTPKSIFSQ